MSIVHETTSIAPSFGNRIARIAAELANHFVQYRTYRRTLTELESLTDSDLADLGLARSSLREVASKAAYGN